MTNRIFDLIRNNETAQRSVASLVLLLFTIISLVVTFKLLKYEQPDSPRNKAPFILPIIDSDKIRVEVKGVTDELKRLTLMQKLSIYERGLVTPQTLINACEAKSIVKDLCNNEVAKITKILVSEGKIVSAKLYVKAGVSRSDTILTPLTQYDSIWFFLDSGGLSGHLLRSKASYNKTTEDGFTELIFDLSNIPFTKTLPYDENSAPENKDLLSAINSKREHLIASFVSTLGYGKLEELNIYYEGGKLAIQN